MIYNAAISSFRVKDPDGSIPCALWFPTHFEEEIFVHGVYLYECAKKAVIAEGKFPLIVMSHGSGGTRFGHCKMAEYFARRGFMVLVPEHPLNNFFDDRGVGSAQTYQNRSRHMKAALDGLLGHSDWGVSVDQDRIAVAGFSLGGYTALTCVGAKPYVDGLRQHIRQNREFDPIFSGYEVIVRDGYDEAYLPVTYDPRYKACVAMAPVGGGLFPRDSLKEITVPVQIFRAGRDNILRHPFHAGEIRENLPAGCDYHNIEKAGHFSFLSPMRPEVRAEMGELAVDGPGFVREVEHEKIQAKIVDFLNKALS